MVDNNFMTATSWRVMAILGLASRNYHIVPQAFLLVIQSSSGYVADCIKKGLLSSRE